MDLPIPINALSIYIAQIADARHIPQLQHGLSRHTEAPQELESLRVNGTQDSIVRRVRDKYLGSCLFGDPIGSVSLSSALCRFIENAGPNLLTLSFTGFSFNDNIFKWVLRICNNLEELRTHINNIVGPIERTTHPSVQVLSLAGLQEKRWNMEFLTSLRRLFTLLQDETFFPSLKFIVLTASHSNYRSLYPKDLQDMAFHIQERMDWVDIIWERGVKIVDQSCLLYLQRGADDEGNLTITECEKYIGEHVFDVYSESSYLDFQ